MSFYITAINIVLDQTLTFSKKIIFLNSPILCGIGATTPLFGKNSGPSNTAFKVIILLNIIVINL